MTDHAPLAERTIGDYLRTLGSSDPAPGGGSVAGLVGALAAGLGQMVVSLTRKDGSSGSLKEQLESLAAARDSLLTTAAADERAYSAYVDATRMAKGTDNEKAERRGAMQRAIVNAAMVPLFLAEAACGILEEMGPVVREGTLHALSDAEMAVILAQTSVSAGLVNVRVNLPLIKDEARARGLAARAISVETRADRLATELREALVQRRKR